MYVRLSLSISVENLMTKSELPAVSARMYTQPGENSILANSLCAKHSKVGLTAGNQVAKMDNIYSRLEIKLFAAFLSGENIY